MSTSKTINRGWLKKQIEKGNVQAKCNHHLTDDYAFDAATGFGATKWKPARYVPNKYISENKYEQAVTLIDDFDLKTKGGLAYQMGNEITLIVYTGYSFTLRIVA